MWLPWSLLLFWLVPRFKAAYHERNARVWLPLFWVMLVVLFFSMSPGKRGIYIMPALPALALASLPLLPEVFARRGVRIAGWVLALGFWVAGLVALALVKFDLLGASAKAELGALPVQQHAHRLRGARRARAALGALARPARGVAGDHRRAVYRVLVLPGAAR